GSVKGQDSAATPAVHVDTSQEPKALFAAGMASFDRGDCPGARPYSQAIIDRSPPAELAPDGWYFDTICRFRDGDWEGTLAGFQELVRRFPGSIYVPGAYYHMGLAYAGLGDTARARQTFEYVREQFPRDETVSRMAAERLAEMPADRGAGLPSSWGLMGAPSDLRSRSATRSRRSSLKAQLRSRTRTPRRARTRRRPKSQA